MLQNRLGTRTKTSQTRVFCVFAVYLPLYQAVNFPKMIDGISLRFRFDRPFEQPFRNQFSELAPGPQHSVQKIPSNGMQNLPIVSFFIRLFDYSFLRSFVQLVVCPLGSVVGLVVCAGSFVRLFVRSFFCSFVRSFICLFDRSFVRLFDRLFVRSFVCSFVRLFV